MADLAQKPEGDKMASISGAIITHKSGNRYPM
jgi:hypothetical protein